MASRGPGRPEEAAERPPPSSTPSVMLALAGVLAFVGCFFITFNVFGTILLGGAALLGAGAVAERWLEVPPR